MKHQFILAAVLLSCATSSFAQFAGRNNGNNFNNRNNQNQRNGNGRNGGGTLPLPEGVNRVISIDAYNVLLAESDGDNGDTDKVYSPIVIQHGYSGGYAALYGGTSIPTAQFVSPGAQNAGGFGGGIGLGGAFGAGGGFGNQGFGNQGFGNQGFGNQGFGNQGFGNQGFGNQGFGNQFGNQGFGNQGFGNQGFNNGFNGNFSMSQTSVVGPNGQQTPLPNGPNGPILFR